MDNFSEYIKSTLENYEPPYDENGWFKIQKTLRVNKIKRLLKYTAIGITSIIFFVLVFISIPETKTFDIKQIKNIENISDETFIIVNNTKKEVIIDNNTKKEVIIDNNTKKEVIIDNNSKKEVIIDNNSKKEVIDNNISMSNQNIISDINIENIEENKEEIITQKDDSLIIDSLLVDTTTIVIPKPTYYFPTAFSPNGDGVNDEFFPIGIDLINIDFQLLVYDRWGNEVFETMNTEYKWDGENCSQGIYIWIFRFQDNDGKIHLDKGQVTLIK